MNNAWIVSSAHRKKQRNEQRQHEKSKKRQYIHWNQKQIILNDIFHPISNGQQKRQKYRHFDQQDYNACQSLADFQLMPLLKRGYNIFQRLKYIKNRKKSAQYEQINVKDNYNQREKQLNKINNLQNGNDLELQLDKIMQKFSNWMWRNARKQNIESNSIGVVQLSFAILRQLRQKMGVSAMCCLINCALDSIHCAPHILIMTDFHFLLKTQKQFVDILLLLILNLLNTCSFKNSVIPFQLIFQFIFRLFPLLQLKKNNFLRIDIAKIIKCIIQKLILQNHLVCKNQNNMSLNYNIKNNYTQHFQICNILTDLSPIIFFLLQVHFLSIVEYCHNLQANKCAFDNREQCHMYQQANEQDIAQDDCFVLEVLQLQEVLYTHFQKQRFTQYSLPFLQQNQIKRVFQTCQKIVDFHLNPKIRHYAWAVLAKIPCAEAIVFLYQRAICQEGVFNLHAFESYLFHIDFANIASLLERFAQERNIIQILLTHLSERISTSQSFNKFYQLLEVSPENYKTEQILQLARQIKYYHHNKY